jgi:putative ABC transport system permease protein
MGTLNGKSEQLNAIATTPEYRSVKSLTLVSGRYLSDADIQYRGDVCVIEETAGVNGLSHQEQFVELQGRRFRIVGMLKKESLPSMPGNPIAVHVPIATAQRMFIGERAVHTIYCTAQEGSLERAMKQVENVLKSRTKGTVQFQLRTPRDIFQRAESMTRTATLVTAGIGMLSLFVGGIGIMNILLASVLERTREIGIRKAVGARKKDILFQFLFESILFSVFGGLWGVASGIVVSKFLSSAIEIPAVISVEAIVVGISFAIATGVLFGVYPAWKAAKLNPIESLRYE